MTWALRVKGLCVPKFRERRPQRPLSPSTGAKKREEVYQAFEKIYPGLGVFRMGDSAAAAPQPALLGPPPPPLRPAEGR